jgi:hypothetical protein
MKMKKGIRGWSFDRCIGFVLVGVIKKIKESEVQVKKPLIF